MKKKLEKKINLFLSLVIIVVLLPLLITIVCQRMQVESLLNGSEAMLSGWTEGESIYETERLEADGALLETENVQIYTEASQSDTDRSAEAEDKVVGIVAKEISANNSHEAILAQCVIARTALYDAWKSGTAEPESLSIAEMQTLWGENFQKVYQNMKACAALTNGQVLVSDGKLIYAAYHAVSAGKTRDMSELYEEADMPYLAEKLCKEDTQADGYLCVLYWPKEEFLQKCGQLFPESPLAEFSQIQITVRDSAGYVLEIKMGEDTYTGEEFRSNWELNSSCFTITDLGEQIRIVTKGLGHGFGLSQYTANLMAAEGKSYEEILAYFYEGTELKQVGEL